MSNMKRRDGDKTVGDRYQGVRGGMLILAASWGLVYFLYYLIQMLYQTDPQVAIASILTFAGLTSIIVYRINRKPAYERE